MATITAIDAQKKNPQRVNVHLDGQFAFGLSRLTAAWLRVGQSLSDEKIAALRADDAREAALQQAMLFLSYRARSVAEVRKNLAKHEFTADVIEATIERMQQAGLLGDEQFARAWVENRNTFRPRGRRVLALELRQKGIAEDAIRGALAESADEQSLALEAGRKYARRLSGLAWPEYRAKLTGHLGRRGFVYEVIASATKQLWQEARETQAADADNYEDNP
jgi:regulatory protein